MPQQSSLAILFADISGSTRLYETLGDVAARREIAHCVKQMTAATHRHGGTLIKVIGDEVMCTFASADEAAAAALEMQEAVSGVLMTEGGNMAIHVGFHYGPVVQEEGDVFGDAVNLASRMVNRAKRDQILTTGATVQHMSPKWRKATRQVDRTALRGKSEEIDVFELVWQEEDITRISDKAWVIPKAGPSGRLTLTYGAHQLEVGDTHPSVTVGRGEQNELVNPDDRASRLHARIEYRNQRFTLSDQSTNGTYVADATGATRIVRHDTHVLTGSGLIGFGHKPEPGRGNSVKYEVSA